MKVAVLLLMFALSACNGQPADSGGEAESENAIEAKASDIRNEADAEVNRQIAEIEAAANAEQAELGDATANVQ